MNKLESSDDLYKLAKRDIDLKRYQKAINECRRGIEASPKNMDLHLLLGRAYSMAGKLDSARIELNYVRERNPRYRDTYIYLVNLEATACNYDQAIEYADEGLKYYPNDRDLLLKKMDIYNKKGDWLEGDRMATYLFEHYSADPFIRSIYIEYKLSVARHYYSSGYIDIALKSYEAVLEQEPLNKEALEAIYNLDVKTGNYAQSLVAINRALLTNPNSYELYMKKLSILVAMSNFMDALDVLEKLVKLYPGNQEIQRSLTYTRMEAGRYYMKMDPLIQFESVLEKEPTNRDALGYVINISYSRGLLPQALQYINQALKIAPNDHDLLAKKLGILETMENYGQAAILAEIMYRQNPTQAEKEHLLDLKNISARNYMADQEYDSAVVILNAILAYDKSNMLAINSLISVYSQTKRYDEALRVIDEALKGSPNNEQLLYRKAGVLEAYQHYPEAAKISRLLIEMHPKNKYYIAAYIEQTLSASRQSMLMEDYPLTIQTLRQALAMQPNNVDAINYLINLELSMKQYDSAMFYVNEGLRYYPDSKDFVFKKSIVFAEAKQYKKAYAISGDLYREFPYNSKFKAAYTDQMVSSGRQYMVNDETDSALEEFHRALTISPYDTTTLYYIINLLADGKKYDNAIFLLARGRRQYPGNTFFLFKRALIEESRKNYQEAYLAMDTLSKMGLMSQANIDYKNMLYSMTLRNELGIFFLNTTYDPQTIIGENSERRIATIQFTRKFKTWSLTGRVNYAGRVTGSGFQYEAEGTVSHNPKWYSWANLGLSNTNLVFPPIKFGYSLFHSFKNGYDGEFGFRVVDIDSDKTYSGVAAVSKEYKDFYFTLKGYLTDLSHYGEVKGPFPSVVLSSRYFIKEDHSNFFSVFLGYGSAPDDPSRLFALNSTEELYKTVSVGAGYQMKLHYRTTLAINYTWYNIQTHVNPESYKNQYDLFVSVLHKF